MIAYSYPVGIEQIDVAKPEGFNMNNPGAKPGVGHMIAYSNPVGIEQIDVAKPGVDSLAASLNPLRVEQIDVAKPEGINMNNPGRSPGLVT